MATAALAIIVLMPVKARAFLGIGDVVFDPTSFAELAEQYGQMIFQYARQGLQLAQETQTATSTTNAYQLALREAQFFATKPTWRTISNLLWRDQANNVIGETAQWSPAINGAVPLAPAAWQNATTAVGNPSWIVGKAVGASPNVSDLATVEIADAAGINTLRTLADFRNAQSANAFALQMLETNALDESADTNVQVRQLNLEAGGTVQMLRSQQNIIDVLGYQLEQQMIQNKPVRDGIAAALSRYAAMSAYQQTEPTSVASEQAAFTGYQLP